MRFNVVVGNPPYNKGMDLDFVGLGYRLSNNYTVMITPAKWQTAEAHQCVASKNMTYGKFRQEIVPHMSSIVFYPDSQDVFSIRQIDGICYFLLDKKYHNTTKVKNICKLQKHWNSEETRSILGRKPLLNCGYNLVKDMSPYLVFKLSTIDKSKRYQVWTNSQISSAGGRLLTKEVGNGLFIGVSRIIDSTDDVDMITRSEASTCSFSSNSRHECECFVSWLNTKFVRFFIAINISKLNNIICDNCFRFVPAPPTDKFDHIYTDEELYKAFNIPQKYIDIIEAVVKERK